MIAYLSDANTWAALATLTVLEVVLGVDNLVFLAITSERLPPARQAYARRVGLLLALGLRVALLTTLTVIAKLTTPLLTVANFALSWRDLVLGLGGIYLLYKGATEIHEMVDTQERRPESRRTPSVFTVILQIMALDLVFSLDSIITAVGMTDNLPVMITAIVIAILVMIFAAEPTSRFIARYQSLKMLALAFLLLVGTALVADASHFHIPRGYLYAAIAFSLMVEGLNIWARRGDGDD